MAGAGKYVGRLASDYASRMARAKEQGFDVDTTMYHGTSGLDELKAFDKSQTGKGADQYGPGFYLTDSPHQASGYAQDVARGQGTIRGDSKGVIQANTGGRLIDVDGTTTRGMEDSISLDRDQVKQMLLESDALKRGLDSDDMNPMGDYYHSFWDSGPEDWMIDDLADKYAGRNPEELTDLFDDNDKFLSALSDATGYDGIRINWPDTSHEVHWKPENIRSVNAQFDPTKRDSSDLLASLALPATVGAAIMGDSENANAGLFDTSMQNIEILPDSEIDAQQYNAQQRWGDDIDRFNERYVNSEVGRLHQAEKEYDAQDDRIYNTPDTLNRKAAGLLDRFQTPMDPLLGQGWLTEGISDYWGNFGERETLGDEVKAAGWALADII